MLKRTFIMFILAFALLIQNTCPFGAAGKSAVASCCENCPLQHSFVVSLDGQKHLVSDSSSIHFPLYVFAVPKAVHTFRLDPIKSGRQVFADQYQDALPDELLRPPQA